MSKAANDILIIFIGASLIAIATELNNLNIVSWGTVMVYITGIFCILLSLKNLLSKKG